MYSFKVKKILQNSEIGKLFPIFPSFRFFYFFVSPNFCEKATRVE